jgi:hypothetical protein
MVIEKIKRIAKELTQLMLTAGAILLLSALFHPVCMEGDVCNYLLLVILVGVPFGIGKMVIILPPASWGISGGIGILALDLILGGLIGCACLAVGIFSNLTRLIIAVIS